MKKNDVLEEIEAYNNENYNNENHSNENNVNHRGGYTVEKDLFTVNTGNSAGGAGGTAGAALGIITLIVFIGGVIGAIAFSHSEPRATIMCVGAIFLWVGCMAVSSMKINLENLPVLIFPVVGALMVMIPGIMLLNEKSDSFNFEITDDMIIYLILFGFFIIGMCLIIVPRLIHDKKMQVCTLAVMARCIDIKSRMSHSSKGRSTRVYAPKWEYTVNGQVYTHQETTYSNISVPRVGDVQEVLVNPNDPNELYRVVKGHQALAMFIGIMFVAISALSIVMYSSQ